jgi:hypothetical protein
MGGFPYSGTRGFPTRHDAALVRLGTKSSVPLRRPARFWKADRQLRKRSHRRRRLHGRQLGDTILLYAGP